VPDFSPVRLIVKPEGHTRSRGGDIIYDKLAPVLYEVQSSLSSSPKGIQGVAVAASSTTSLPGAGL